MFVIVRRHKQNKQTPSLSVWTHFMLKAVKLKFDCVIPCIEVQGGHHGHGSLGRQAPHIQRVGVATLQNPFGFLEARSGSWFRHDRYAYDFHLMECGRKYFWIIQILESHKFHILFAVTIFGTIIWHDHLGGPPGINIWKIYSILFNSKFYRIWNTHLIRLPIWHIYLAGIVFE